MIYTTDIPLFESLLEVRLGNTTFDLHNEFTCVQWVMDGTQYVLSFTDHQHNTLRISFGEAAIIVNTLPAITTPLTIDLFYRGRFVADDALRDTKDNKGYLYLDFYEGYKLELFSKTISYSLTNTD
ncbi:MAG: hypothetical protein BGO70_05010 [Bacteroidetes bacterium 43-93]|nr:hypothetical protein [Bacteroidota bacterium]OJW96765.1 MAG: hypothetical protein BGO70_05010 [Bacteroidetes bacterium 43-93]